MGVTATNIVQGPATIYIATFGAPEPADSQVASTPAASAWTDVGGTDGGAKIVIDQKYSELSVDQLVDRVGSRLVSRNLSVEVALAEATLTNLKTLLNGGTTASGAGYSSLDPINDSTVTQPSYSAIIVDGWAPGTSKRRRLIVRKVLQVDSVETNYSKDKQSNLSAKLNAHYVSPSVTPFHWVDEV